MNRKYRITAALIALVVAVSVTALAAPVAAQTVDNVDLTLSDQDGDGLDDYVEVEATVSNDGGATVVEFVGDGDLDLSDTSEDQAPVVSINDNKQNENVTFGSTGASTTYTVNGSLSGQSDGDTIEPDVYVGDRDRANADDVDTSTSATVQNNSGSGGGGGTGATTTRTVNNGDTIFIDERGIDTTSGVFAGNNPGDFEQDGVPLNLDESGDGFVVQDQSTGQYTIPGTSTSVTVQEAEIDSVRVIDLNTGARLDQGDERIETSNTENVQVAVRYNFEGSSFIDFDVIENDLEVTERYLSGSFDQGTGATNVPAADGRDYDAVFNLTMDDSGQFEVVAAAEDETNDAGDGSGNRDVGFDEGVEQSVVLEMVDEDDIEINLDQNDAFQGEDVLYDLEGLNEEEHAALLIEADDLRDETPRGIVDVGNEVFDPVADGTANGHVLQVVSPGVVAGAQPGDYLLVDGEGADIVPGGNVGLLNSAGSGFDTTSTLTQTQLANVIRNEDVSAEFLFGVVERDGTSQSQLDTEYLDDTGVDIDAYAAVSGSNPDRNAVLDAFVADDTLADDEDEDSLTVDEAEITIDSPGQTYVPGQDVDINGTTSDGVDDVSVFVRDRDNYYHVVNITVDGTDDTYEEEDFELSDAQDTQTSTAADILSKPGVYRYGVVDQFDVDLAQRETGTGPGAEDVYGSDSDDGLESSDFNEGASTQQSIRVAEPSLDAEFQTYNDEIFRPDGIDYEGTLIGPRDYVVLFTDSRGGTVGGVDQADRDGEIDEDFDLSDVRSGNVGAALVSPGRDGTFGDGVFSTPDDSDYGQFADQNLQATPQNLVGIISVIDGKTRSQTREILLAETVEEEGSDDLIVSEEFRLSTDSRTQIEDVVPEQIADNATGITGIEVGETMSISGTTNRNPEDATVVVEAVEGPSIAELGTAVTDEWGTDGEWNVTIEVPESVEPGQYTIQSDDGERVDEANVTISAEGTFEEGEREGDMLGELQNEIEELRTQVDNLESERDDLQSQVDDLEATNEDLRAQMNGSESDGPEQPENNTTDDGEGQPGFTAVAALISLIAVALLAIRRQEE